MQTNIPARRHLVADFPDSVEIKTFTWRLWRVKHVLFLFWDEHSKLSKHILKQIDKLNYHQMSRDFAAIWVGSIPMYWYLPVSCNAAKGHSLWMERFRWENYGKIFLGKPLRTHGKWHINGGKPNRANHGHAEYQAMRMMTRRYSRKIWISLSPYTAIYNCLVVWGFYPSEKD